MWRKIVLHSLTDHKRQNDTVNVIACWIPKATNTVLKYVVLTAFPMQQWKHERASILRYRYSACLLFSDILWLLLLLLLLLLCFCCCCCCCAFVTILNSASMDWSQHTKKRTFRRTSLCPREAVGKETGSPQKSNFLKIFYFKNTEEDELEFKINTNLL